MENFYNDNSGIRVPGSFTPGTVNGYVTDAKYVRGTYIVLRSFKDTELIPQGAQVEGTIIYVVREKKEYRMLNGDWVEIPPALRGAPMDSNIYAMRDGRWVRINLGQFVTKKDLSDCYYTKDDVDDLISNVNASAFRIVDKLPRKGTSGILYLVFSEDYDMYLQYIYEEDEWRQVGGSGTGSSSGDVDLSDYYTKAEVETLLSDKVGTDAVALVETNVEQNTADIDALEVEVDQLSTDIDAVKTDVADVKSVSDAAAVAAEEAKTEVDAIKSDIDTVKASVTTVETDVDTLKTDVDAVEVDVESVKASVEDVKTDVATNKADIATNATAITEVKASVTGLETETSAIKSDVDAVETDIDSIKTDIATIESDVDAVESDVTAVKSDIDTINSDITSIKSSVSTIENNVDALSADIDNIENDLITVTDDVADLKTSKQDVLVSGSTIKTVNGESVLGSGDITIDGSKIKCMLQGTTTITVGGLEAGSSVYGYTYDQIISIILNGVSNPTFTDPSVTVTLDKTSAVMGSSFDLTGTITFNRGTIDPAYGTSGYRAGEAVSYIYGDEETADTSDSYNFTLSISSLPAGVNTYTFGVNYSEGEQPLNSAGAAYSTPLEAGQVTTTATVTGITALYSGNADTASTDYSEEDLTVLYESDEAEADYYYQITSTVSTSADNASAVAIPSSMTLYGVKIWDELGQQYVWAYGSAEESLVIFKASYTYTITIDGVDVEYTVYTDVDKYEDYPIGERKFRFYISADEYYSA